MIRYLKLYRAFFINCLVREMEFRAHFFLSNLISISWSAVFLLTYFFIFRQTSSVNGWTLEQMLLLTAIYFLADRVYDSFLEMNFEDFVKDGTAIKDKDLLMKLTGNPLEILKFERTVLNILQRMSGIATATNSLIIENNLRTPLAATRKTLWGLLDKKAVFIGGGLTHRLSLSDEILIKNGKFYDFRIIPSLEKFGW